MTTTIAGGPGREPTRTRLRWSLRLFGAGFLTVFTLAWAELIARYGWWGVAFLWWPAACLAAVVSGLVVGAVLLARKLGRPGQTMSPKSMSASVRPTSTTAMSAEPLEAAGASANTTTSEPT